MAARSRSLFGTGQGRSSPVCTAGPGDRRASWRRFGSATTCGGGSSEQGFWQRPEIEAARREVHLDTHSYQAPDFYRHRGYEVLGELPGWPGQTTRISLRRILQFPSTAAAGNKGSH